MEDSSLSTRYDSPSSPYLADGIEEICFVAKECQFSFCIYVMTREAIRWLIDWPKIELIALALCIIFDVFAAFFIFFNTTILTKNKTKK